MQCLEISGAVGPIYGSLGVKGITGAGLHNKVQFFLRNTRGRN